MALKAVHDAGVRRGTVPLGAYRQQDSVRRAQGPVGRHAICHEHYAPYFIFLPILGLCFSIIAFFVIRREFMYYNGSDAKLLYVEMALGLTLVKSSWISV